MFYHVWKKYLPFINIQLKKADTADQVMNLNRIDFEKAGSGRKAGYKFTIEFNGARVSNVISGSTLAQHLAFVMLENDATRKILANKQYSISLNTKFQLTTKNTDPDKSAIKETEKEAAV